MSINNKMNKLWNIPNSGILYSNKNLTCSNIEEPHRHVEQKSHKTTRIEFMNRESTSTVIRSQHSDYPGLGGSKLETRTGQERGGFQGYC